jgi:TonB family protein
MVKIRLIYFILTCLLLNAGANAQIHSDNIKQDSVYKFADIMPAFPGGQDSLIAFLSRNLKYPEKARQDSTVGMVIVQFVVDEKGDIIVPNIIKSLSPECDAEVIRVLSKMPSWHPGKIKGKKVKTLFTLPVSFRLG